MGLTLYILKKLLPTSSAHKAQVLIVAPIVLRAGVTVITPDGIGEVTKVIADWETKKPSVVGVMLYRGYIKYYMPILLQQYVVFHKPMEQFILLSPNNYQYIGHIDQLIEYRITNRQYAQMTDKSKAEYAYVKTLIKQRGGPQFLKLISKQNLVIKRKG